MRNVFSHSTIEPALLIANARVSCRAVSTSPSGNVSEKSSNALIADELNTDESMFEGGAGRLDESEIKSGSSEGDDCRAKNVLSDVVEGENIEGGSDSESNGRCIEKN